jgi:DNA-binding beta-propeller fold protein YncE
MRPAYLKVSCSDRGFMKKILLCISYLLLIISCSKKHGVSVDADNIVVFPSPPDTVRIQYLTTINNSMDAVGGQSAFRNFIFGEPDVLPIVKPYGIAVNNSKIYICDTGIGSIEIIDLEKNTFDYFTPGGIGALKFPVNCSFDNNGRLFVADANRGQVVVFDNDLNYVDAIGIEGDFRPTGI